MKPRIHADKRGLCGGWRNKDRMFRRKRTMRNITVWAVFGTALLTTGCGDLLSLHPLYTEQDRVFDATLEGRWESNADLLFVDRAGDGYEVTLQSKKNPSEQSKYETRLVDIGGVRFADLLPLDAIGH